VIIHSELGSTVLGLKCEDIMSLDYYDVGEAITTIDLYSDMPPDLVKYFHSFILRRILINICGICCCICGQCLQSGSDAT